MRDIYIYIEREKERERERARERERERERGGEGRENMAVTRLLNNCISDIVVIVNFSL